MKTCVLFFSNTAVIFVIDLESHHMEARENTAIIFCQNIDVK